MQVVVSIRNGGLLVHRAERAKHPGVHAAENPPTDAKNRCKPPIDQKAVTSRLNESTTTDV